MTQSTFLADTQRSKSACETGLLSAVRNQISCEKASFHTPGHKGRLSLDITGGQFAADLTELPGLDELANAHGALKSLQSRAAAAWRARSSFISVNGASAALTAAIMACAGKGTEILLPRNVHRSAVNALVLTGLKPIWYEPEWISDWGIWGGSSALQLECLLKERIKSLAAVIVCSPNYAGLLSNIERIASVCKKHGLPLIVDEAHGAHLMDRMSGGALSNGADVVVHSLHKTLSGPTQTGLLHVGKHCAISDEVFQAALNTLQSSSPSYLLMLGIEKAIEDLEENRLNETVSLASSLRSRLADDGNVQIFESGLTDPLHVLIRHMQVSAQELYDGLAENGVFAEAVLGDGVLLLIGVGSSKADLDALLKALENVRSGRGARAPRVKPTGAEQVMNPREAFFATSKKLPSHECEGKIACDWIAPCPPGYPVVAPGQRISREIIESLEIEIAIRVINHPQLEGDSDGPNTAS